MWRYFLFGIPASLLMLSCTEKTTFPEDALSQFIAGVSHGADTLISDMTLPIVISFRLEMDKPSVEEALEIDPPCEYSPHWTASLIGNPSDTVSRCYYYQLYIYPDLPLRPNTIYRFSLGTGAQDLLGNPLPEDFIFQFTTDAARLNMISAQYNGLDTTRAFPDMIKLWFNTGIDISGLDNVLQINPPLEYELSHISTCHHAFEYRILSPLHSNTHYAVSIRGSVLDIRGNPVYTMKELEFETGTMAVIYYYPNQNIQLKERRPIIQVRFNTTVAKASVQEAFQLRNGLTDYPGSFYWLTDKAMLYYLESDLQSGEYTFSVSTQATDYYGVHLPKAFSYAFIID